MEDFQQNKFGSDERIIIGQRVIYSNRPDRIGTVVGRTWLGRPGDYIMAWTITFDNGRTERDVICSVQPLKVTCPECQKSVNATGGMKRDDYICVDCRTDK